MMTTVITASNLSDLNAVANEMETMFPGQWELRGDAIAITYDESERSTLYNVASKLDFIEFMFGMEGRELRFENGPAVLLGVCESYEMEQLMAMA